MKTPLYHSALAVAALLAPVHTSFAQAVEKTVAFKTADGKYISAAPNSAVDLSGTKVGSRQVFVLVDTNGGELSDGDSVKIMQAGGDLNDPSAKGLKVARDGAISRGASPNAFTLKKMDTKWAFQTPDGKFVGATPSGGVGTVDTPDTALQVELVEAAAKEKKPAPAPASTDAAVPPQ